MATTFPFASPNNLPEINFIAGSNQELTFNVFDSGSTIVDISGASISWNLSPYGLGTTTLTKTGVLSGSPVNQFKVYLLGSDTTSFYGKYVQQYSLTDTSGSVFRPSQGLINITKGLSTPVILDSPQ